LTADKVREAIPTRAAFTSTMPQRLAQFGLFSVFMTRGSRRLPREVRPSVYAEVMGFELTVYAEDELYHPYGDTVHPYQHTYSDEDPVCRRGEYMFPSCMAFLTWAAVSYRYCFIGNPSKAIATRREEPGCRKSHTFRHLSRLANPAKVAQWTTIEFLADYFHVCDDRRYNRVYVLEGHRPGDTMAVTMHLGGNDHMAAIVSTEPKAEDHNQWWAAYPRSAAAANALTHDLCEPPMDANRFF